MKKITLFAMLALCAFGIHASELYWMVKDGAFEDESFTCKDTYAVNLYTVWGEYTQNKGNDPRATQLGSYTVADLKTGIELSTVLNGSGYSGHALAESYFFLEIQNSSQRVAATDKVSYASLANYIGSGSGMAAPLTAYEFDNFSTEIVPEPTSGLLVLIGALALGLKRKKEIV